eukprot:Nk52_evm13s296 gene=Nk52_evmTU13s296
MGKEVAARHRNSLGHFIRPYMPSQHQEFFNAAPWLLAGSVDNTGQPVASLLHVPRGDHGEDGPVFVTMNKEGTLFSVPNAAFMDGDSLKENIRKPGSKLGLLGIELTTRRRNRLTAHVSGVDRDGNTLFAVDQSFGNCPKYIQSRTMQYKPLSQSQPPSHQTIKGLPPMVASLLSKCDTFFIATCSGNRGDSTLDPSPEEGADVSHRGGPPGFVSVKGSTLRFPDYVGNGLFNTLGNIHRDGRVCLLVIDFSSRKVVKVFGIAHVLFDVKEHIGSERTVHIDVEKCHLMEDSLAFTFGRPIMSSFLPAPAGGDGSGERTRFLAQHQETPDVKTFTLKMDRPLAYQPGQYATFRAILPNGQVEIRAWTLSSTPRDGPFGEQEFQITVKEKPNGQVSPYLHNSLKDMNLYFLGVDGNFTLKKNTKGIVMVAAGSGITPIMSILRRIHISESINIHCTILYSVKTAKDIIFARELNEIAAQNDNVHVHIFITSLSQCATEERHLSSMQFTAGRIKSQSLVTALKLSQPVSHAYVCGPEPFSDAIEQMIVAATVSRESVTIVRESFQF